MKAALSGLLGLLYPRDGGCEICSVGHAASEALPFCADCLNDMISAPGFCARCGSPVGSGPCPACVRRRNISGLRFVGIYRGALREAIHLLKYARRVDLGRPLGLLLAEMLRNTAAGRPGAVVPVPLYRSKRADRGFNQAEIIAETMCNELGWPLSRTALRRIRATTGQASLGATDRRLNTAGAFLAVPAREIVGAAVLLVDDVVTTGSTAEECAKALLSVGAGRIDVAVLAAAQAREERWN